MPQSCRAARDLSAVIKQKVAFDCGWRPADGSNVKPKNREAFLELQGEIRNRVQCWKQWSEAGNQDPPKSYATAQTLIGLGDALNAYAGA